MERAGSRAAGDTGLALVPAGAGARVRSVLPGSSAARAGIVADTLVLAVDGIDAPDLGTGALRYLLSGQSGTAVSLEVQDARLRHRLRIERQQQETGRM